MRIINHPWAAPEHHALSEHNCLSSRADTQYFPFISLPTLSLFLSPPKTQLTLSRHSLPSPGCWCPREISGRNSLGWELEPEASQWKEQCLGVENSWSFRGGKAAWRTRKECACHFKRQETSISPLPLPTSVYWKGQSGGDGRWLLVRILRNFSCLFYLFKEQINVQIPQCNCSEFRSCFYWISECCSSGLFLRMPPLAHVKALLAFPRM